MERRDILKASALFLGYAVTGATAVAVMKGCKADTSVAWKPSFLESDTADLMAEVAERIIPKTDTPGAKDALVHRYIDEVVNNNYTAEEQSRFKEGVKIFDVLANEKFSNSFVNLDNEQKDDVLQSMADASKDDSDSDMGKMWKAVKGLVVTGYFTSEEGATKAMIFNPIPGPFEGCIPISEVDGAYYL